MDEMRRQLPMAMLGFDTANDSVFQTNGAIVRRTVGYRRFEGITETNELDQLYALQRLYGNYFQPSFKLAEKFCDGAKVVKR